MNPLISIIIPVYNVYSYLPKCVASLRAQTYSDLEIILVDDGSSDGTEKLCDELAAGDSRIKVIHKENGGPGFARNAGLDIFTGDYLLFLDSDDYIEPNLIERCLEVTTRYDCDMVIYSHVHENLDGTVTNPVKCHEGLYVTDTPEAKRECMLYKHTNYGEFGWTVWNRFIRADFIKANHLRFPSDREVFSEDLAFVLVCAMYINRFYCIPDRLYHYIMREGSITVVNKRFPASKYLKLFEYFEKELARTDTCPLSKKDVLYIESKLLSGVLNKPDWSYRALAESCSAEPQDVKDICISRFGRVSTRLAVKDKGLGGGLSFSASHRLVARILKGKPYRLSPQYLLIKLLRLLRRIR